MKIDQNECLEITIDLLQTLMDENNPVYDDSLKMICFMKGLQDVEFETFLTYKTGISFGDHDESFYDLYLEALQSYILDLLAEEEREDELELIDKNDYLLKGYEHYTLKQMISL